METEKTSVFNTVNSFATGEVSMDGRLRDEQGVPLVQEILVFLKDQIEKFKPELIIVIERKGTAILRTLKELPDNPLDWNWRNVISSASLKYTPDDLLVGKRILIFDDMLKTGLHMKGVIDELKNKGESTWESIKDQIYTATFVIHRAFEESSENKRPDAWFYHYIETVGYSNIRNQIVNMLQKAGSLMLDTEHIEVRVKVNCEYRTFFEALARKAKVVDFHSGANRLNATIYYSDDLPYKFNEILFPVGTRFDNIVKKCRVVYRGGNEFALIPICYPSIPVNSSTAWPTDSKICEIFSSDYNGSHHNIFQEAGLLAAIEVLTWALIDIYTLPPEYCHVSLPMPPSTIENSNTSDGFSLSHLTVVYPLIDIEKLTEYVNKKGREAYGKAVRLRSLKFNKSKIASTPDEDLYRLSRQLIQYIRFELDERIAARFLSGAKDKPHPCGLTAKEIFALGRHIIGGDKIINYGDKTDKKRFDHIISALFDILIDNAYLVTHVQEMEDENGIKRYERTFEPDGEVISEKIRRYTALHGFSNTF